MSKIIVYNDDIHRKRREIMRRYRATHHDKVCEINRRSWNKNKEKRHIGQKQYAKIHPLASVHNGMMKRCGHRKNNNEMSRHYYEKRGVTVCPEWRSFPEFEKWALSNGYETGLQIDRINPDLGYSPSNCRFVTARENAINRRSTFRIE